MEHMGINEHGNKDYHIIGKEETVIKENGLWKEGVRIN